MNNCAASVTHPMASTKFFHAHANAQWRRNFIHSLEHGGCSAVSEEAKVKVALDFFESIWEVPQAQARRVRLDWFDLPHAYLSGLCGRFSEDEVWLVVWALPPDKAPGPDGFSTRFLQVAWPIIRHDLMLHLIPSGTLTPGTYTQ
jgi:hypothetical protein